MPFQDTITREGAGIVETMVAQTVDPVEIADGSDAATTQTAVNAVLVLLRQLGITVEP